MSNKRHHLTELALLSLTGVLSLGLSACQNAKVDPYNLDFSVDTKGTSIDFWTPFGSVYQAALEEVISEFTKETGITVNMETKGGYDALNNAITLGASTYSIPEVTLAYPDHEATYVSQDIIVRLDYYEEKDGDDTYKFSDFYKDYMTENQSIEPKEDGSGYYTLGVPFNKSTEVMVYNKTFFDWVVTQTGGTDIKVPTTWDEVNAVGPKITSFLTPYFGYIIGSDGKKYASSTAMPSGVTSFLDFSSVQAQYFKPFCYDSQANYFITTCRQWGGSYTTFDSKTQKGYLAFDSDEVKAGLAAMKSYHDNGAIAIPSEFGGTSKYSSSYFKVLQSVMAIGSSAGVENSCPSGDAFKVGVAPLPYHVTDKKYVISQGTNLCLLDKGTAVQRVAAWKLIKYLSKNLNGMFAAATDYFPSCDAAAKSSEYQAELDRDNPTGKTGEDIPSTAQQVKYYSADVNQNTYLNDSTGWTKFVDPGFTGSSTIREAVNSAMGLLFVDNKTPAEVISSLYQQLGDYVKK